MKTKEIEVTSANGTATINVAVPDDFSDWTEEGQLKYLFTLRYMVDVNKNTIYNSDAFISIRILES